MKFSIYKKCCNTNWPVITDVSSFCAHREQASYSKQQSRIFWKKKKTLGNRTRFIWMELKMTIPKHVGGESRPRCTCIYLKPYVLELSSNTLQPTWPHMNWVKYMHIYPKKSWLVRLEMRVDHPAGHILACPIYQDSNKKPRVFHRMWSRSYGAGYAPTTVPLCTFSLSPSRTKRVSL